jgi:hypothetical protein
VKGADQRKSKASRVLFVITILPAGVGTGIVGSCVLKAQASDYRRHLVLKQQFGAFLICCSSPHPGENHYTGKHRNDA